MKNICKQINIFIIMPDILLVYEANELNTVGNDAFYNNRRL